MSIIASLHFGNFAGILSKAIWVALGVASTYVILSGLRLWLRRRDGATGWRLYEKVFDIVAFGLPLSLAASAIAFFIFAGTEQVVFWTPGGFAVSAVAIILLGLAMKRRHFAQLMWLSIAVALAAMPFIRIATGGPGWPEALSEGRLTIVAIDLLFVLVGACAAVEGFRRLDGWSRPEAIAGFEKGQT